MKNIKYIVFSLLIIFINTFHVFASCTNDELLILRKKAENIKISYKHLGLVELENGESNYNDFEVNIKNVANDLILSMFNENVNRLDDHSSNIKITLSTGNWNLKVYSDKCDNFIYNIDFELPRFNIYSLDPLCDNIDSDEFKLCGKYYDYYVSYEEFIDEVQYYLSNHGVDEDNNYVNNNNNIVDKILAFMINYRTCFIIFGIILLLFLLITIIIRKIRKRGVLE